MAITNTLTALDILNRVAVEVGHAPVIDPYSSSDPVFVKLRYLLNIAGEELVMAYPWEFLQRSEQFDTAIDDTGDYPLPDDFGYMIDQTGWERNENVPLGGPLSAQDWTMLKGRELAQSTLYASFRLTEGVLKLFPDPPIVGLDINYEYISLNWVKSGDIPAVYKKEVTVNSDVPLFDRTLITRYLKLKYLESTGFDTTKAQDDFAQNFSFLTGKDKGAPILNAGNGGRGYPYLSNYNTPDSGFGIG